MAENPPAPDPAFAILRGCGGERERVANMTGCPLAHARRHKADETKSGFDFADNATIFCVP